MKVTIGRIVWHYLNDDLVPSPALVINTHESTDVDLLERHCPVSEPGSVHGGEVRILGAPIVQPTPSYVDLLVGGLVRTYRAYNVPEADEPTAGHWMWPPRV